MNCRLRICSLVAVVTLAVLFTPLLAAQGPLPDAPVPSAESGAAITSVPSVERGEHKFFDKTNCALFATSIALSGADFAVTRANLQNGGRELNPLVRIFGRSTGGLIANFTG